MSTYKKITKHPYTKEFENAEWLDDYYGNHNYGVRFPSDNRVFPADKYLWEFENVKNENIHFSSKSNDWSTPKEFFDTLNKEFKFNLDPCASNENAKCINYFTKEIDGLSKSWDGFNVFCNPPYGREIGKWVKKASEAKRGVVVMLIPARTDTKYFHEFIYNKAEIRFLKGRLKFGGVRNSAPFPSMLVIFKNK